MSNKHRIRIAPTKKRFDAQSALRRIAEQYMQTERQLTPLIKAQAIPPNEAVVLIVMYADAMIAGKQKDHQMTEKQIIEACNTFIHLWKIGLFVPSPDYPYTLEETVGKS